VSKKCLSPLIHLFAGKLPPRIYVTQSGHQGTVILGTDLASGNPAQPIPKKFVERGVLAARYFAGPLDVGLVGAEGDVL